jgi:hypothetical protein
VVVESAASLYLWGVRNLFLQDEEIPGMASHVTLTNDTTLFPLGSLVILLWNNLKVIPHSEKAGWFNSSLVCPAKPRSSRIII